MAHRGTIPYGNGSIRPMPCRDKKAPKPMKPYLILLKYNGYTKTVVINHMTADLALTQAYKKFPDVKKCNIIKS